MRYYKGDNAVPREERFCDFCLAKNNKVIGDETHVINICPEFNEVRSKCTLGIQEVIRNKHLTGCIKLPEESAIDYSKRRRSLNKHESYNRNKVDWETLLGNVDLDGVFRGWWKDVTIPIEGYQEIAWHFGKLILNIETVKRERFEKKKIRFNNTVIHDCLEDLAV